MDKKEFYQFTKEELEMNIRAVIVLALIALMTKGSAGMTEEQKAALVSEMVETGKVVFGVGKNG